MNLRRTFLIALTVFAVTLAIVIGKRLSGEALAMLLGVVMGVSASLPGSFLLFQIASRAHTSTPATPATSSPRVLVVQTPAPSSRVEAATHPTPVTLPSPRQFVVIGEDMIEVESSSSIR